MDFMAEAPTGLEPGLKWVWISGSMGLAQSKNKEGPGVSTLPVKPDYEKELLEVYDSQEAPRLQLNKRSKIS